MIQLFNKESGARIGEITEAELNFLIGQMEEESMEDKDYYLNAEMIDVLATGGADAALLSLLRNALGNKDDLEIRWERTA
jgi:hypothetical protein